MRSHAQINSSFDRRNFLRGAGGAVAASLLAGTAAEAAGQTLPQGGTPETISRASVMRPLTDHEKATRVASNSYPIRWIFKNRGNVGGKPTADKMQAKYGTITMLDFPAFTVVLLIMWRTSDRSFWHITPFWTGRCSLIRDASDVRFTQIIAKSRL